MKEEKFDNDRDALEYYKRKSSFLARCCESLIATFVVIGICIGAYVVYMYYELEQSRRMIQKYREETHVVYYVDEPKGQEEE